MKHASRLFYCALCLTQTTICSHCDRGQLYCSAECSQAARKKSCIDAGLRYQNTFNGKMKHALRQRRYRARQREKVTHHGSQSNTQNALLHQVPNQVKKMLIMQDHGELTCCFCKKISTCWLRIRFLRHSPKHHASLLLRNRSP
jgi:hypothetical protein